MIRSRALSLLAVAGGLTGFVWGADVKTPQTKVSYSEAYGRNGPQPELTVENELPRFPAVEASLASATFQVKPGFRVELAASEPNVTSPVTIAFDEFGRMFVAEMVDYSERREETPHAGRIRRLEDTNGDGVFDRSVVFAEDLPWPTALICSQGGIYVGATPDILWLKDTNNDGRADERSVVFTGFGSGAAKLNVQALLNSFNWGLDNRIHGATGPIGAQEVRTVGDSSAPVLDLRGRDFSFDPLTRQLRPESGGGQYGLSFDSQGRKFVCSNSDHLQLMLYDAVYSGRNPAQSMPGARVSIAEDGPAAEVFRISPDEPWRIVRTRWRISGVVPGMVEGGGRVSGYFTGATGATIYRGDAYGPEFVDNAFIGDAGGNLVHRKVLVPDDVSLVARRPADEKNVEFLASKDTWFRPVHFQNGPDGCLYVVDMYREVIEHPWSIPESIKKHLDLNSGNDRGRIWRIVPENFQRPNRALPGTLDRAGRVAALASPNGWTRETAARLIYESQDRAAVPELIQLFRTSPAPLGRLHALYALQGLRALTPDPILVAALADADERVREHAVKLSEPFLRQPGGAPALAQAVVRLTADPSARVRYQLAFTLAYVPEPARLDALVQLARRDAGRPWPTVALLSSLKDDAGGLFGRLVADSAFRTSANGTQFLKQVAELIGARNARPEVAEVLTWATRPEAGASGIVLGAALLEGARRGGVTLRTWEQQHSALLAPLMTQARSLAVQESAPEADRLEALRLLALTGQPADEAVFVTLAQGSQAALRRAAIQALGRSTSATATQALLVLAKESPARRDAVEALVSRPDRTMRVLAALKAGELAAADIPAATVQAWQQHKDSSVEELARSIFPPEPSVEEMLKQYEPALTQKGDVERGRVLYLERCASCHRSGRDGYALGPDLVTVQSAGRERVLRSILQPNAEVAPQYIAFQVETRGGESYSALIGPETPSQVTLRLGGGRDVTLPRSQVMGMASSGQSLMPEGLAAGLSVEAMTDLLAFISQAPPPQ